MTLENIIEKSEQLFWEKIPDDITLQKKMYETQIKPHFESLLRSSYSELLGEIVGDIKKNFMQELKDTGGQPDTDEDAENYNDGLDTAISIINSKLPKEDKNI